MIKRFSLQTATVQDFFLLLSVCNTVIVAKHPHRDSMNVPGSLEAATSTSVSLSRPEGSVSRGDSVAISMSPLAAKAGVNNHHLRPTGSSLSNLTEDR